MQFNLKRIFRKEKKESLIIVGLGNPGEKYQDTFHNMGYMTVDTLCEKLDVKCKRALCSSLVGEITKANKKIVIAKPVTYMNLSGQAVKSLLRKYNADIQNLLVIYDDIDLPRYSVRARKEGGGGTHNGMKNIIDILKDNSFKRIRIGIGKEGDTLRDYVLSVVPKDDKKAFQKSFDKIAYELIEYFQHEDFEKLMRVLNTN